MNLKNYRPRGYNNVRELLMYFRRREAAQWVSEAKRKGLLRPATDFSCADCGKPAKQYDHRDYSKPDKVDPVCHNCHGKRGSGLPELSTTKLKKIYAKKLKAKYMKDTQALSRILRP